VYCQNKRVSSEVLGKTVTEAELEKMIFSLVEEGAHNINLVTPSHYADVLARLLERIKPSLGVPVVWNSSAYELKDTLKMLDGLVDIYLPDLKYFSPELSKSYSAAPDYFEIAIGAIKEMKRQVGSIEIEKNGTLKRGLIVRHLVLPGCRKDSLAVLDALADAIGTKGFFLSVMSQYTPDFYDGEYKELKRRITTFEYESVLKRATELGYEGYMQDISSASSNFTPDFTKGEIYEIKNS
jgi:putative pyruvate formate lyase activating enzyme